MVEESAEQRAAIEYAKEMIKTDKRRQAVNLLRQINTPTSRLMLAKMGVRPPLQWRHYLIALLICGVGIGLGYAIGAVKMQQDMYRYFLILSCRAYHNELGSIATMGKPVTRLCTEWVDRSFPEKFDAIQPYISRGCTVADCLFMVMGVPPWPPDVALPEGRSTLTPHGYVIPTATAIDLSQFMTP